MRIRRPEKQRVDAVPERAPFDWILIPCASREAAAAEARLQQDADTPDAVWIYLQSGKQWVARRTPVDRESAQAAPRIRGAWEPLRKKVGWWIVEAVFSR